MSLSRKYGANGKTFHVPWSEGTDSTDRKNWNYWVDIQQRSRELVFTEKLDGQGSCLNEFGVFARSHAAPSDKPWDDYLKVKHAQIVADLKAERIELFGESMYAIHSIEYPRLDEHFKLFAVRQLDRWLSWEEVQEWAFMFDMTTVPVLTKKLTSDLTEEALKQYVKETARTPSTFGSYDVLENSPCSMEGVVFRNADGYHVDDFVKNVFKIVRKGHVKTDERWETNWKRAFLISEMKSYADAHGLPLSTNDECMDVIRIMRAKKSEKVG